MFIDFTARDNPNVRDIRVDEVLDDSISRERVYQRVGIEIDILGPGRFHAMS
jgi:hypothetical protein